MTCSTQVVDDALVNIDGGETVEYKWIHPAQALKDNEDGIMAFLPPQYYVLSLLSAHKGIDSLINHFTGVPPPTPM